MHRALQQFGVKREADFGDLTALFIAENLTRAAYFQIVGGERKTDTEFFQRFDGQQALLRIGGHGTLRRHDQVGVGAVVRAAHAAANLV